MDVPTADIPVNGVAAGMNLAKAPRDTIVPFKVNTLPRRDRLARLEPRAAHRHEIRLLEELREIRSRPLDPLLSDNRLLIDKK